MRERQERSCHPHTRFYFCITEHSNRYKHVPTKTSSKAGLGPHQLFSHSTLKLLIGLATSPFIKVNYLYTKKRNVKRVRKTRTHGCLPYGFTVSCGSGRLTREGLRAARRPERSRRLQTWPRRPCRRPPARPRTVRPRAANSLGSH